MAIPFKVLNDLIAKHQVKVQGLPNLVYSFRDNKLTFGFGNRTEALSLTIVGQYDYDRANDEW